MWDDSVPPTPRRPTALGSHPSGDLHVNDEQLVERMRKALEVDRARAGRSEGRMEEGFARCAVWWLGQDPEREVAVRVRLEV